MQYPLFFRAHATGGSLCECLITLFTAKDKVTCTQFPKYYILCFLSRKQQHYKNPTFFGIIIITINTGGHEERASGEGEGGYFRHYFEKYHHCVECFDEEMPQSQQYCAIYSVEAPLACCR